MQQENICDRTGTFVSIRYAEINVAFLCCAFLCVETMLRGPEGTPLVDPVILLSSASASYS